MQSWIRPAHAGIVVAALLMTASPLAAQAPAPAPPVQPAPYISTDVTFSNGAITIAGTLTVPKAGARVPAVVLISGSEAQDRDETVAV